MKSIMKSNPKWRGGQFLSFAIAKKQDLSIRTPSVTSQRWCLFSSVNSDVVCVSHEQLLQQLADPATVVVDVRNPHELTDTGMIPGTINIPRRIFCLIRSYFPLRVSSETNRKHIFNMETISHCFEKAVGSLSVIHFKFHNVKFLVILMIQC